MSDQNPPNDPTSSPPPTGDQGWSPPPTSDEGGSSSFSPPPPSDGGGDWSSAPPPPPGGDAGWSSAPPVTDTASQYGGYGDPYAQQQGYSPAAYGGGAPAGYQQKEKLVAGLLGILLGGFGVHSFYLGDTKKGVIQIVVTLVTCGLGSLWGLIEGIMILTGSIDTDANGVPLKST